jgi:predicted hotdog family 3-hydroxylacyl-ACP dehydratase
MCLLDAVLDWDTSGARCTSTSHRALHNPLRAYDRLGATCGIEYAAQAMAVHGALVALATGVAAPRGYLASVRGVELQVDRLDDVEEILLASVERLAGDEHTVLYQFALTGVDGSALQVAGSGAASAGRVLVTGRAAIAFDTGNFGLLHRSNGHS